MGELAWLTPAGATRFFSLTALAPPAAPSRSQDLTVGLASPRLALPASNSTGMDSAKAVDLTNDSHPMPNATDQHASQEKFS